MDNECFDVNECTNHKLKNCPDNSDCVNTDGSYTCKCKDGFVGVIEEDVLRKCYNIDEYRETPNVCELDSGATCVNTYGSFECSCPSYMRGTGYSGDPCIKEVECKVDQSSSCEQGYFPLGQMCYDIDECRHASLNICPENSNCVNTDGSYTCVCHDGFVYNDNFLGCSNINECQNGDSCEIESGAICADTYGSFECSCPSNMQGTGYVGDPCHSPNNCNELDAIVINMKSKSRFNVHTEGENTVVHRIILPQVPETTEYTGFFVFGAKYCGEDFVKQLSSEKIM